MPDRSWRIWDWAERRSELFRLILWRIEAKQPRSCKPSFSRQKSRLFKLNIPKLYLTRWATRALHGSLSVCLSLCFSISLSLSISLYLSSISLSISLNLSLCISLYLSLYISLCISLYLVRYLQIRNYLLLRGQLIFGWTRTFII